MASTMMRSHFPTQQGPLTTQYAYVPQPPPSPPMDEMSKCSLPSISNLLGLADQGSPTSETHSQSQQQQQQASTTSQSQLHYSRAGSTSKPSTRPSSSHYGANQGSSISGSMGGINHARGTLPPTPPMSTDASFDGYASPSTKSITQASAISQPQPQPQARYYETTPPLDAEVHRPSLGQFPSTAAAPTSRMQRTSVPAPYPGQPLSYNPSSAVTTATPSSYFPPQPNPLAAAAFFPPGMESAPHPPPPGPAHQLPQVSSLYFQRPLPQVFPPPHPVTAMGGGSSNNNSLWQHHHYISPSAAASFPQSQDRYICPTCNKAFSRPSSLRIHSHSHTGEKPFKCPHAGCGKAFSVRSNMKRHERGCHSFEGGVNGC